MEMLIAKLLEALMLFQIRGMIKIVITIFAMQGSQFKTIFYYNCFLSLLVALITMNFCIKDIFAHL